MKIDQLKPNSTVRGTIFPEPVQIITGVGAVGEDRALSRRKKRDTRSGRKK